ncbi:MAG: PocR ligand-binding domain-containing protein, partial [Bdellovibrio sp.]
MSMISWDDFEHIHVIKKLRQILSGWWNVDIVFTDERGQLKGLESSRGSYANPATQFLLQKEVVRNSLSELVGKSFEEMRTASSEFVLRKWDSSGFDVGVFPIVIENDFMGFVVATGFFKDPAEGSRSLEIRDRLAAFGAPQELIEKALSKIKYIDGSDREHFCELISLVAQEIVTLHLEVS